MWCINEYWYIINATSIGAVGQLNKTQYQKKFKLVKKCNYFWIKLLPEKTLLQNIADKNKIKIWMGQKWIFSSSSCYELCIKFKL